MYVTVITSHSLGGGTDVEVGDVLDVNPKELAAKTYSGFVRPATVGEIADHLEKVAAESQKEARAAAERAQAAKETEVRREPENGNPGSSTEEEAPSDQGRHPEADEPGTVENRDPEGTHRDPRARTRRGGN